MIEFAIQQNVVKMIVDHVKIPVTADIESGYGEDDQTIVDNIII
jgi:2-methylisocitrate lyase-like PEP mutase family enzyme